jgi:hypothetical protein
MRKFRVEFEDGKEIILFLNERVIDVVDDEWRSLLYDLKTPEDIAAHVAYNLVINRISLNKMDGWADQPKENASFDWVSYGEKEDDDEIFKVTEIKDKAKY